MYAHAFVATNDFTRALACGRPLMAGRRRACHEPTDG